MPPKGKAAAAASIPSLEELHTINERLDSKPEAADYNKLIAGAKGDVQVKSLVARLIPKYHAQFPKAEKESVEALKSLCSDENTEVQIWAIRGLKDFFTPSNKDVCSIVYEKLASDDPHVSDASKKLITDLIDSNEDYKKEYVGQIKDQEVDAQVKMIDIATEKYTFTEENVDELLNLIDVCFDCDVEQGLKLLRRNKKIISDEKKEPLVNKIIDNLNASLDSDFENVTSSLLESILQFIPTLGQAGRILNIVAEKVLPKASDIPVDHRIKIIQQIADNARNAEDPKILENLYNYVYLTFPKVYETTTKVNFSLLEATLFALFNLSKRFSKTASQLTGQLLVITGQPDENEGVVESAEKKAEFRGRLENIDPIVEKFIQLWETQLLDAKQKTDVLEEEKKQQRRQANIAIRTGKNVRKFCRILCMENFVTKKPPTDVSWRAPAAKDSTKGGKGGRARTSRPTRPTRTGLRGNRGPSRGTTRSPSSRGAPSRGGRQQNTRDRRFSGPRRSRN